MVENRELFVMRLFWNPTLMFVPVANPWLYVKFSDSGVLSQCWSAGK